MNESARMLQTSLLAIEVQLIISLWAVIGKNLGLKATPKSVAQKKAFFKAHYKKIAAMDDQTKDNLQEVTGLLRLEYHIEEVKEDYTCVIESKVSHNDNEEQVEISVTEGSGKHHEDDPSNKRSRCAEEATSVHDQNY
ncbi:hypothetical protein CTI12_AA230740 [Artemisia annua]|uniref:Uncharacterized protein n=1 Tax=Artemisia annua TaxID=35608 RepID=A0A2U1NTS2_ARTAN|nr:hypothetical protein CTI12_AA230740 [Artemisia annua]